MVPGRTGRSYSRSYIIVCVFLKPLGPIPRSSVRLSPRSGHGSGLYCRSGHGSGLYWHPAVPGCGARTYPQPSGTPLGVGVNVGVSYIHVQVGQLRFNFLYGPIWDVLWVSRYVNHLHQRQSSVTLIPVD